MDTQETLFDLLERIAAMDDAAIAAQRADLHRTLLASGEQSVSRWLEAHGQQPTQETHEGYRLLALHRQAARPDPSFNACRESCRELIYQCNVAAASDDVHSIGQHTRLAANVAKHLLLFIDGKLENSRMGEFCCAARPLRARDELIADAPSSAPRA